MLRVVEDLYTHLGRLEKCMGGLVQPPPLCILWTLLLVVVQRESADPILSIFQDVSMCLTSLEEKAGTSV